MQYEKHLTSGNEIRLMRLKPGCEGSPLEASIGYYDLSENPRYQALSYTWGSPFDPEHPSRRSSEESTARHCLDVDGTVVEVTENLYGALLRLRPSEASLRPIALWIDAVCIDQSNHEEKAWQIPMMREIYSRASRVLVWLGPSDATSDTAMDSLGAIYRNTLRVKPHMRREDGLADMPQPVNEQEFYDQLMSASFGKMFGLDIESNVEIPDFPIEAVANLLSRAYWCRGWCWQEFALGKKMSILCGGKFLEDGGKCIDIFLTSFDWLRTQSSREPFLLDQRPWSMVELRRSYHNVVGLKEMGFEENPSIEIPVERMPLNVLAHENPGMSQAAKAWLFRDSIKRLSMKELLKESSMSWIENSRREDHIFALAGMAVDSQELGIRVDCTHRTVPWEEVYTQLMVAYVRRRDLWFLHYCQATRSGDSSNLPYWVPDWSKGYRGALLSEHYRAPPNCLSEIETASLLDLREVDSHSYLRLRGIIVDEITWVSSERYPMSINELETPLRQNLYRWIRELTSQCPHQSRRTIWTVLIANSYHLPLPKEYLESKTDEEMRAILDDAFNSILDQNIPNEMLQVAIESYLRCFMQATNSRCLFQTSTGRLGIGLSGIQKGHQIAVFMGVDTPFVVKSVTARSSENPYRIMCETYVHGLMEDQNLKANAIVEEIILE